MKYYCYMIFSLVSLYFSIMSYIEYKHISLLSQITFILSIYHHVKVYLKKIKILYLYKMNKKYIIF